MRTKLTLPTVANLRYRELLNISVAEVQNDILLALIIHSFI